MKQLNENTFKKALHRLLMCVLIASSASCNHDEDDMYITPQGFAGKVMVIYGSTDGEPVKWKGKRRIFKISSNGILRTKALQKKGFSFSPSFYRQDEDGTEKWMINLDNFKHNPGALTSLPPGTDLTRIVKDMKDTVIVSRNSDSLTAMIYLVQIEK